MQGCGNSMDPLEMDINKNAYPGLSSGQPSIGSRVGKPEPYGYLLPDDFTEKSTVLYREISVR